MTAALRDALGPAAQVSAAEVPDYLVAPAT